MARHTNITYTCEKCGVELETSRNVMDIVTSLSESMCWSRLHVQITHVKGINNTSKEEKAELCRNCTIFLLKDALGRVCAGERASKGVESSTLGRWEGQ